MGASALLVSDWELTYDYYDEPNYLGNYQDETHSTVFMSTAAPCPLASAGFFGAMPSKLLKTIYHDGKIERTFTYSDYNEYGYPCTMKIVDDEGDIQTYKFTWVKI